MEEKKISDWGRFLFRKRTVPNQKKERNKNLELTGEILGIIYQNEINSYTIAEIYANELEKIETIVGYLPFIAEGDEVKLIGKIVEHKEYGEQFKVDSFEKLMPQSLEALERYLGNGTIKGVGPATARKIVETFGDETLDILKYDPSKLQKVRGISSERALEILEWKMPKEYMIS